MGLIQSHIKTYLIKNNYLNICVKLIKMRLIRLTKCHKNPPNALKSFYAQKF